MNIANINPYERRIIGWLAIQRAQENGQFRNRFRMFRRRRPFEFGIKPSNTRLESKREQPPQSEVEKLQDAVDDTHRILAHTQSMFPFKVFPEIITVDRQKLTIVYKKFFNTHQEVGVPLENVKNIQADIGPLYGSLIITSDLFINNTQVVEYLPRKACHEIQQLVQGIIAANSEGIDLSKIETSQLKDLLCKLGEGHVRT